MAFTTSALVHRAPSRASSSGERYRHRRKKELAARASSSSSAAANDESATNSSSSSLIQSSADDEVARSPYYRELSKDVDLIDATMLTKAPSDFFELLDLDLDDADVWAGGDEALIQTTVSRAFKRTMKISHPDVLLSKYGADVVSEEDTNAFAVILNAAYKTLSDPQTREPYLLAVIDFRKHFFLSEETKFDGTPVSKWSGEEGETRAIFVDESECIGCGNCAQYAAKTFSMTVDKDYGRARVIDQWADDRETIEIAIDLCPVDCIWFVKRSQLAALEHCMKFCPREDPGIMGRRRGGNFGSQRAKHNPFSAAESF